jgi:hypothetical protein
MTGYFTRRQIFNFDNILLSSYFLYKVSPNLCRENQNTHFVLNDFFFENCAVYEIMWKSVVERGRSHVNTAQAHCMLDT